MDKEKKLKRMALYGWLFFALAALNVVQFIVEIIGGEYSREEVAKAFADAPAELINTTHILVIVFSVIILLITVAIKIFLGIKGLKESKGTAKGEGYITFATVVLVIEVLIFLSTMLAAVQGTIDALGIGISLVTILVLFDYTRIAKQIKENK